LGEDLTDQQREDILVDFDSKFLEETASDDFDEDYEYVEVSDEFGRTRLEKRTKVLGPVLPQTIQKPYVHLRVFG
jgi:hypothetical protein